MGGNLDEGPVTSTHGLWVHLNVTVNSSTRLRSATEKVAMGPSSSLMQRSNELGALVHGPQLRFRVLRQTKADDRCKLLGKQLALSKKGHLLTTIAEED